MGRTSSEALQRVDATNRMGLKAPGILTFLLSFIVMLAVLFAKYFGASIPGLNGDVTQFAGLLGALDSGSWRPVIDSVVPLEEAATAVESMAAAQHFGKLVLSCS